MQLGVVAYFVFLLPTFALAEIPRALRFNELLRFHRGEGYIDVSLFIDPLPIPEKIKVPRGQSTLRLPMRAGLQSFYGDLPPTPVWGFGGVTPGPTIEVEQGQSLTLEWKNDLPARHLLPSHSEMAHASAGEGSLPEVRTVVHLHGAAVPHAPNEDRFHNNDGWPDFWITPGETQIAHYQNQESARMLWYHDHAMGQTSRNIFAGLFGAYLIRDHAEEKMNLPSGNYEIPLLFETKDFNDDGTLSYPLNLTAEVYGSTVPVNGKISPYLRVEPRKYRFRMVNAASARSFAFKLINVEDESDGPELVQIGNDGGFFESPITPDRVRLSPAERADVIVDFSKFEGKTLLLHSNWVNPAAEGTLYIPNIMIFKVDLPARGDDSSAPPSRLRRVSRLNQKKLTPRRGIVLDQVLTPGSAPVMVINDRVWGDPITERVKLGSTEIWEIANPMPDSHPFHMHLVQFQVLSRQEFDRNEYAQNRKILLIGESEAPPPTETGWKDTVTLPPGSVTRIITRFGPYPGRFLYHCHILEHEDMGMMRPFEVVP